MVVSKITWVGAIQGPRGPAGSGNNILEYDTFEDFPESGEVETLYIDKENSYLYRWEIDEYVALSMEETAEHIASTSNPHSTSLINLIDTTISSPLNNDVLTYNTATSKWIPQAGVGTHLVDYDNPHSTSIENLIDTDASSPNGGDILVYNDLTENWETYNGGLFSLTTGVVITDSTYTSFKMTINDGNNTLVDIAAGRCLFVDNYSNPENPVIIAKDFEGIVGFDPELPDTSRSTWIYAELDSGGDLVFDTMIDFDLSTMRERVIVGRVINSAVGHGPEITTVIDVRIPANGTSYSGRENLLARGSYKVSGGILTVNSTNKMRLNKSAIVSFRPYIYAGTNVVNPNFVSDAEQIGIALYAYHLQGVQTTSIKTQIDSLNYDLNGVLTSVPVNKYTCQRVYYFPKTQTFHIVYGQRVYNSLDEAYHDMLRDAVLNEDILFGAEHIGYILLKRGTTNLETAADAVLINYKG